MSTATNPNGTSGGDSQRDIRIKCRILNVLVEDNCINLEIS